MKEQLIARLVDTLIKYKAVEPAEVSSAARHLADCEAYELSDGALQPNPAAVKQLREAGFSPVFIRGVAQEAAARIEHPAQRTLALFAYQGTSLDEQLHCDEGSEDLAGCVRALQESGSPFPRLV